MALLKQSINQQQHQQYHNQNHSHNNYNPNPMPALKQDGPRLIKSPGLTRKTGILITLFSILVLSLFYLELSRHARSNINLDLDHTPLGETLPANLNPDIDLSVPLSLSTPPPPTSNPNPTSTSTSTPTPKPHCKIGHLYGSCFTDDRFFQCTPAGLLAHPCPAGQKFFCTGEGTGECDVRHRSTLGRGSAEMVCDGKEELGACREKK